MGLAGVSKKNGLGVGANGLAPGFDVAAVDERRGDAEARTKVLNDVAAGAEHRARGDDMLAGAEAGEHGSGDGGHAGGAGASLVRALAF